MSRPVWVQVFWSENKLFKENSLVPFVEFESLCNQAARQVGTGNGYDKTKVKILFDDGNHYDVRLDLCEKEDTGFKSYCESMCQWIGSEKFIKTYHHDKEALNDYQELKDYLKKIEWP